jgi:hypothetical protein
VSPSGAGVTQLAEGLGKPFCGLPTGQGAFPPPLCRSLAALDCPNDGQSNEPHLRLAGLQHGFNSAERWEPGDRLLMPKTFAAHAVVAQPMPFRWGRARVARSARKTKKK